MPMTFSVYRHDIVSFEKYNLVGYNGNNIIYHVSKMIIFNWIVDSTPDYSKYIKTPNITSKPKTT